MAAIAVIGELNLDLIVTGAGWFSHSDVDELLALPETSRSWRSGCRTGQMQSSSTGIIGLIRAAGAVGCRLCF